MKVGNWLALKDDSGFTLLELLAVLAIVSLTTVLLAFPMAERSRRAQSVRSAAIDLAAMLQSAHAEAKRSNMEQRTVIDLTARRFWTVGGSRPHALPPDLTAAYDVPAAEQAAEGMASIRFRPDGSSSGGTVRLSGQRQSAIIAVDWLTGRTHIEWGR